MVLAISVIATLIVSFIIIDSHGNFGILLFITFEFGLSMIMFAFILTSFFTKAKTAAAAGGLMVVLLSCFYYLQVFMDNVPTVVFWFLSLLSPNAFAMAVDRVSVIRIKNFRISRTLCLFVYISKLSALLPPQPKAREIMRYFILVI